MDWLYPILLSWASYLSGYPMPAAPPTVEFKEHQFFVEMVCGGIECNVYGWYDDQDIVYIDERLKHMDTGFATSLVVHEFTHYLQHKSGDFDSNSCKDSVKREQEAYVVQNSYILESLATVYMIYPHPIACNKGEVQ